MGVEIEFGIPNGGARLIWNSRLFGPQDFGHSLEQVGLYSGEQLTCIQRSDSRLLAFLARLRIDKSNVNCTGHGLGGSTETLIRLHLADEHGPGPVGATFELWAVETQIDGYESCEAQVLWLDGGEVPTCL